MRESNLTFDGQLAHQYESGPPTGPPTGIDTNKYDFIIEDQREQGVESLISPSQTSTLYHTGKKQSQLNFDLNTVHEEIQLNQKIKPKILKNGEPLN